MALSEEEKRQLGIVDDDVVIERQTIPSVSLEADGPGTFTDTSTGRVYGQEPGYQLGLSLRNAARRDPDEQARIISMAEDQGLPPTTVERNLPEVNARHNYGHLDPNQIAKESPTTAAYLSDPNNAAVSIDDVENLQGLERNLQPEHGFWSNSGRLVVSRTNELVGNLVEFGGTLADSYRSTDMFDPGIAIGEDGISWHWDLPEDMPSALSVVGKYLSEGEAHRVGYKPRFTWEKLKGEVTPTNLAGFIVEQGAAGSLPDMVAAIATLPAYIASRTEEIAERVAQNDQRTDADMGDISRSLVVATVISLLERIGAKGVFDLGAARSVKDVGQAAGEAFVKEGVTEFVQEGLEYYGETVGTRTDVNHLDALDRAFAGLVAGAPMGGAIRGTTATVQAIGSRVEKNAVRAARSMNEQMLLEEFLTLSQDSTTRERAQDRFKDFLKAAGRDRAIYIPATEINALTEQGVELPAYIVEQAQDVDADVEIPIDRFATEIAVDPDLIAQLRPHIKLSNDAMTGSELETDQSESLESLMAKAAQAKDIRTEIDEIYEEIKDQLVATGRQGEETAKWSAMLYKAFILEKVEETARLPNVRSMSPREVFELMNFKIVGPSQPSLTGKQQRLSEQQQKIAGKLRQRLSEATTPVDRINAAYSMTVRGMSDNNSDLIAEGEAVLDQLETEGYTFEYQLGSTRIFDGDYGIYEPTFDPDSMEALGRQPQDGDIETVVRVDKVGIYKDGELVQLPKVTLAYSEPGVRPDTPGAWNRIADGQTETEIAKRQLDKRINVIESLVRCMAS